MPAQFAAAQQRAMAMRNARVARFLVLVFPGCASLSFSQPTTIVTKSTKIRVKKETRIMKKKNIKKKIKSILNLFYILNMCAVDVQACTSTAHEWRRARMRRDFLQEKKKGL